MNLSDVKFSFEPSKYQYDFFNWIVEGQGSAILEAYAGSAKTSTAVEALKVIPTTKSVLMVAFNRHIAAELKRRVNQPNVTVKTFHGLGYSALTNMRPNIILEERKSFKLLIPELNLSNIDKSIYIRFIMRLLSCGKNAGVGKLIEDVEESWDYLIDHFDLEIEARNTDPELVAIQKEAQFNHLPLPNYAELAEKKGIQITQQMLQLSNDTFKRKGIIDYDDMVFLPLLFNVRFDQYDYVIVDELQDVNACQLEMIARVMSTTSRFIGIGDKNQCQPAGTLVQTTGNVPFPIENCYVGQELPTFDTKESYFPGIRAQGRRIRAISKRSYKGFMYTIQAGTHKSRSTLEHKWLIRLNIEKAKTKYIVYLMMKEGFARIGTTQLIRSYEKYPSIFGLSSRCRQEKANRAWILKVCDSREEAYIQEQIISTTYGLTDMCFHPANGQKLPKYIENHQDYLDAIHQGIGDSTERVIKCLTDFGKDINYPIYHKTSEPNSRAESFGTYSSIVETCNLLDDVMEVKIFDGDPRSKLWEPIKVTKEYTECEVYSLELDERNWQRALYISDGIVTHNSIYQFRGADENAVPNAEKKFNCIRLPLPISYRCPKSVIAAAKQFVTGIEPWEKAENGKVEILQEFKPEMFKPGDVILCRNNAPLLDTFYYLAKHKIGAKIIGRDIATGLVNLIKKVPTDDLKIMSMVLKDYLDKETKRLIDKGKEEKAARLAEKIECIDFIISNSPTVKTVTDLILTIESMFTDDASNTIILSTIHRMKGGEADNVYILNRYLLNGKFAVHDWQKQAERNLHYVAITRAKKNLYYIDSKDKLLDAKETV